MEEPGDMDIFLPLLRRAELHDADSTCDHSYDSGLAARSVSTTDSLSGMHVAVRHLLSGTV
jgi:hypothetical protein